MSSKSEYIVLRVEKANRPSSVQWSCVVHTGLPEWAGTKMLFDLVECTPLECELSFRHIGLTPKLQCYDDGSLGWDHFLMSLVGYVERGRGGRGHMSTVDATLEVVRRYHREWASGNFREGSRSAI